MKTLQLRLFIAILFVSSILKAQDIPGFNTGNYAGISGIDLNPASIADSRYKFDMGVGFGFTFTNNYLGLSSSDVLSGRAFKSTPKGDVIKSQYLPNGDYSVVDQTTGKESIYLKRINNSDNKMIYMNSYQQMPSFMVSLSPTTAMAFTWRIREMANLDNLTPNLAEIAYYGNDPKNKADIQNLYWKKQLNNDGFAFNTMVWNEFGLGLAQVLTKKGKNFLKVGGRIKLDWGVDAAYVYGRDLNYRWQDKDHLDLLQAKFGYGHSNHLDYSASNGFKTGDLTQMITHPGFVGDIGAVYEYRPDDRSTYTYDIDGEKGLERRDLNKYKWKVGASLVDIGAVGFTKGGGSDDFHADVRNMDVNHLKLDKNLPPVSAADKLLKDSFQLQNSPKTFNMVLPMALSFQIDYHAYKGFYAQFTSYTHPSFIYKDQEHLLHSLDYYSVTPRWESKWIGVYVPITVIQTGEFMTGLTLRLGPLVIGTMDISPFLGKEYIRGIDLHAGLKIPLFYGKPKDKDHDGVSDKRDKCPTVPGTWENHGCPPEKKKAPESDRDKDGVIDRLDSCPDVAGLKSLHGCPDRDHDGIADKDDKCPDDSGLAYLHGCPDKDGDSITDKEDKCPEVKGTKEHHGCPDTDGDGVFDDEDRCPHEAGPIENHGCPWGDLDKDGVPDNVDKCPDTPGPVENHGCPWGDKDGDGVPDNVDKCPETPGPKSNNGCPVIEKKTQRVLDSAVANLQFTAGKDVIKPTSYESLDNLAAMMLKNPTWKLSLAGHTDNEGNVPFNMELSRKRALSVKKYLTDKGVENTRIIATWFGPTKPIAPNDTWEGRAKNRRVEMKVKFD